LIIENYFVSQAPLETSQIYVPFHFSVVEEVFFSIKNMGCKILAFHSGDYEECHPLGCYALWKL
jgi:hypothetical protein